MRTRLLKRIRKRAFLKKRNNEYKAVLKGGLFRFEYESEWTSKSNAIYELSRYILMEARDKNKKAKETIH